jgi:hypothetical protein
LLVAMMDPGQKVVLAQPMTLGEFQMIELDDNRI